ncbi:MAG: rRNA maturation RNase YbeY [Clostridia bacterium]|nr:rRNA maturation RNase YbeY [Clostridia bacterium]
MKSDFRIDSEDLDEEELARLCHALTGLAESDAPLAFELVFVDEEEIKRLNARERGVDAVTDVLSFPTTDGIKGKPILADAHKDCIDEEGRILLGSIAICKKRAEEQAKEYGHSLEREIFYLTVHGVLHCLGYDHMTEEDKKEMRAKEEEVMARMNLQRD